LISKNWTKVIKINKNIASIPFFKINIPLFSKSVRSYESNRVEKDDKVELEGEFRPFCLSVG